MAQLWQLWFLEDSGFVRFKLGPVPKHYLEVSLVPMSEMRSMHSHSEEVLAVISPSHSPDLGQDSCHALDFRLALKTGKHNIFFMHVKSQFSSKTRLFWIALKFCAILHGHDKSSLCFRSGASSVSVHSGDSRRVHAAEVDSWAAFIG